MVIALYPALDADASGVVLFKGEAPEVYRRPQGSCIEAKDFPLRRTSIAIVI